MKKTPRWLQGPRPFAYGDVWDAMTPRERARAFIGDILVASIGALLLLHLDEIVKLLT